MGLDSSLPTHGYGRHLIDGSRDPIASRSFDDLIREAEIGIEPVTVEQARVAREAYRDFGRGKRSSRPAELWGLFRLRLGQNHRRATAFQRRPFSVRRPGRNRVTRPSLVAAKVSYVAFFPESSMNFVRSGRGKRRLFSIKHPNAVLLCERHPSCNRAQNGVFSVSSISIVSPAPNAMPPQQATHRLTTSALSPRTPVPRIFDQPKRDAGSRRPPSPSYPANANLTGPLSTESTSRPRHPSQPSHTQP